MAKAKSTVSPQRELTDAPVPTKSNALVASVEPPRDAIEADALAALATVEEIEIKTPEDYEQGAQARANLRARHESTERRRVSLKQPFLDGGKQVDAWFKVALDAYAKAQNLISDKLRAYDKEQARIAEEKAAAERKRIADELERRRLHTQSCLGEIQGLNQQVMIATGGRLGVRKGGTLECIRETLQETIDWPIKQEEFGEYFEAATKAKMAAIAAIKLAEQQFIARQEAEAREAEAKANTAVAEKSAEQAKRDAAAERQKAIEARKLQMKAEADAKAAQAETDRLQREAAEKQQQLEQQASNVKVEDTTVQVAGLARATVYTWKLIDKTKVKPEYLILDEKAINAVVRSQKTRATETVGGIEVIEDKQLRQQR